MKILADENIDLFVVNFLRARGHDVLWIMESARGSQDVDILKVGLEQQRVIVTFDHDFGELVFRHGLPNAGVILLRFQASSREEMLASFQNAWPTVEPAALNHFIVVSDHKIRIRPIVP